MYLFFFILQIASTATCVLLSPLLVHLTHRESKWSHLRQSSRMKRTSLTPSVGEIASAEYVLCVRALRRIPTKKSITFMKIVQDTTVALSSGLNENDVDHGTHTWPLRLQCLCVVRS